MQRIARLLLIVTCCAVTVAAQSPSVGVTAEAPPKDAAEVMELMRRGEALLRERKDADGRALLERARDGAAALGLQLERARALCGMTEAFRGEAKYVEAESTARECLEAYTQLADNR